MDFEKSLDVLPLTKFGISSLNEFRQVEKELQDLEYLKKIGLTSEEIQLYLQKEAGVNGQHQMIESRILKQKFEVIFSKIEKFKMEEFETCSTTANEANPSTVSNTILPEITKKSSIKFYPKDHPMNTLDSLENDLFSHLKGGDITPITKRRKLLRRLQRKKEKSLLSTTQIGLPIKQFASPKSTNSLWDVKELLTNHNINSNINSKETYLNHKSSLEDLKVDLEVQSSRHNPKEKVKNTSSIIGPKRPTMYTIKDSKIVRLEPLKSDEKSYKAVDIVLPTNLAEERLLEGTKLSFDEIRKIERFKDYEPGIPSKVLYLKNISSMTTSEDITFLFNQYVHENQGPIDVRLMSGRLRGQAFVHFLNENLAGKALEEVNGTIVKGKPIVIQFGKSSKDH